MNIAVAFSGMGRSFKTTYNGFIQNIINLLLQDGHHVDIIMHVWDNKYHYVKYMKDEGNVDEIISLYKPVKYQIETYNKNTINRLRQDVNLDSYLSYIKSKNYVRNDNNESDFIGGGPQRDNRISHFYGYEKVKNLILEYENETKIHYDYIIKNRLDNLIFEPLNLEVIKDLSNTVYSTMGYEANDKHINLTVNDMFILGSRKPMLKHLSIYSNLPKLLKIRFDNKHPKPWQPPGLVRHNLVDKNVTIKRFYMNHIVTRRLHKYKALNSVVTGDNWNIPIKKTNKIIIEPNRWI
mgnify:FL=1